MQAHDAYIGGNVEINLRQTGCGGVNWIVLGHDSPLVFCGNRDEHSSSIQRKFLGHLSR